ncbi:hypothetical protein EMCRGX_G016587 [Ephydatia muelleri]
MLKRATSTETLSQPVCQVSGYAVKFVTQLLKRHECPICYSAMKNPVQTECGHLFCRGCLEPILDGPNPLCPLDKTAISRAEVRTVSTSCIFLRPTSILGLGIVHLAEIPCPFKQYGCTFVTERKKMPLHFNEYQIQHTYLQADYSAVMKGQVDKIIETTEHLSIRVSAVENQMSSALVLLEGLKKRFENEYDRQNITTGRTAFGAQITSVHEKMNNLQRDLSNMIVAVQKSNEHKEAITLASHFSPHGAGSTDHILERVGNISVKTTELEHGLDRCLSSCLDQELRLQLLERATYNGVLLWKIDDFARRRKEAVDGVTMSLYSIPFYTSRHGYKMCARVYLNGDGMGKGTHLSFFFVVMKGPFDALLPWPFKQKVTLTIINQAGKKHVTDTFRPDPQSNSFQRPTQKEMNVASGCPMFIRHEQLLNGGFVKDDCIFLRTVVDTSIDDPLMLK